jgi:hypothetical protein
MVARSQEFSGNSRSKACMFDALIEYALCSADAGRPRDESK